jgi:anti-sigma regulatory factor (Ser/Thr protein kinase)
MLPAASRTGDTARTAWTSPAILLWPLGPAGPLVRRTRRLLAAALDSLPLDAERTSDALLMIQEPAANAAEHGEPPYELRVYHAQDQTTVELIDGGARLPVLPRQPAAELTFDDVDALDLAALERGRGLVTVTALSEGRCGVRSLCGRPGKAVWFAIPRHDVERVDSGDEARGGQCR